MSNHKITIDDINTAHYYFDANEPRDIFYKASTELVHLTLNEETSLTIAEALAVLLQTWNQAYYRYYKFDSSHFSNIENLLNKYLNNLKEYRSRTIYSIDTKEYTPITTLFYNFELVMGPVGAAKALHLLAPSFFPLWDRAIAQAYGFYLHKAGFNSEYYWKFMLITRDQCLDLSEQIGDCQKILKSIDEYNYCKFTKKWMS